MIVTQNGPQNIDQVKTFFEYGDLFLSPEEYQRENAWNMRQKQRLIDTIFLGMDIPKFYFWKIDGSTLAKGYPDGETKLLYKRILERKRCENDDTNPYVYEVVDGQQRIRTILEFMGVKTPNTECYRGTWHDPYPSLLETPMAKGRPYAQLNPEQKIHFGVCRLTIMLLESAKISEVREMFLRLQNGTPLNSQQKRYAIGSKIGRHAREIAGLPFFTTSVNFNNTSYDHLRVISQMLLLESRDKIMSCTSHQLDKFYDNHMHVDLDSQVVARTRKVVKLLGSIFPNRNPALNRSYALGLYWMMSQILQTYEIPEVEYPKVLANFERLDQRRLEAMNRDYANHGDDILEDLSQSMSRGTDGAEQISDRYEIITQFLFDGIALKPLPNLDPKRNFTFEERLILFRRAEGKCQLGCSGKACGREIVFEDSVVDHITPHSRGGITTLENGRLSHRTCNISRGVRDDFNPETQCCLREQVVSARVTSVGVA